MRERLWAVVPDRIRRSYALKFRLVAFTVIVLIAVIGGVTFLQTESQLTTTTQDRLASSASAQADSLSAWLDGLRTQAGLLTQSDAVANGDTATVQRYLNRTIDDPALDGSIIAIHYLNTSVPVVEASSNPAFVGVNPEQKGVPWAQGGVEVTSDRPQITDAFPGPKVNQPVIAVLAPIETKSDHVLVLMVNVGSRAQRLPTRGNQTTTRVVNEDGTIMMSHRKSEILTQNAGPADEQSVDTRPVRRGLEGERGYAERSTDNGTIAMGYAPVEGADWVVTTRTPKSAAFALQRSITRNLVVLVLVTIGGFLAVGFTVGRPTARALDELSDTASAIASGNVETSIPESNRIDELGQVQDAFRATRAYVRTVARQVEAIADQEFDAAVFDEEVPGPLGEAIENTKADLESSIEELETARDDAMEAQREAERMATELDREARQFRDVMGEAAAGDLTQRLDTDQSNESMAEIARCTNEMLGELEQTVASVRGFATEVDESSETVTTTADEIENASNEVATTASEIADGATQQSELLEDVYGDVNELSATVEEIAASSREVAEQSTTAADLGSEGCQQAVAAADQISETASEVETVADEVRRLNDEMERIGEIVTLIDEIAEQTNMLALNANIEAARAGSGDAGEGFAVVADEVKSLAEETSNRTEEIEDIITSVQESTDELAGDMRAVREEMLDGASEVTETKDIFEDVVDRLEEANDGIQAIDDATDQQAEATEDIVAMADEVSEISKSTAEDTDDLAAAAEEQTASITTVSEQIASLSTQASRLRDLTADFTIDAEAAGDDVRK